MQSNQINPLLYIRIQTPLHHIQQLRAYEPLLCLLTDQVVDVSALEFLLVVSFENHLEYYHPKEVDVAL